MTRKTEIARLLGYATAQPLQSPKQSTSDRHFPLLNLTRELLVTVVTFVNKSSLPALRLSCRVLYRICISARWKAIIFREPQTVMSWMLAPLESSVNAGTMLPTSLTHIRFDLDNLFIVGISSLVLTVTRSARFIVLPRKSNVIPCPAFVRRLVAVLLAIYSAGKVKHLHFDLSGLSNRQIEDFHNALGPDPRIGIESLTICDRSWPIVKDRFILDLMRSLHVPSPFCLVHMPIHAKFLVNLHISHTIAIETLPIGIIQRSFPQLEKLSLGGYPELPWDDLLQSVAYRRIAHIIAALNNLEKLSHLKVTLDPPYLPFEYWEYEVEMDHVFNEFSKTLLERMPLVDVVMARGTWPSWYIARRYGTDMIAWGKVDEDHGMIENWSEDCSPKYGW